MKKIIIYLLALAFVALSGSCRNDDLNESSIFDTSERQRNEFDQWILENYTYPYNIDLKYRMQDIEAPLKYTLAPADLESSKKLAKVVKFLWLDAYDEVMGVNFTRTHIPKIVQFIGSGAYDNQNTMVQGTAEGGMKVTLFSVNDFVLDPSVLNSRYFKTMHHEFAHILHQTRYYDVSFQKITESDYVLGDWYLTANSSVAYQKGFVSAYARHSANEDFVEIISIYVTNTPEYWSNLLTAAGSTGSAIILQKFEIVSNYLNDVWGIDIDELRSVVQRRSKELYLLDLDDL